jgi:hypothetical protein
VTEGDGSTAIRWLDKVHVATHRPCDPDPPGETASACVGGRCAGAGRASATGTGMMVEYEHRLRRFDGVYRWFYARGLPLRDSANQILRWYVLLTDIDDRKPSGAKDGIRRIVDRCLDEHDAGRIQTSYPTHPALGAAA